MSVLKEEYKDEIIPALMEKFEYNNVMEVPELEKIVINMGLGDAPENANILDEAVESLRAVTGQDPVITRAQKSVSNFKIRKGMPVGCKVTLRKNKMYEFIYKLINIALPRVRDFRGLPTKSFDGRGNYSLGITNYTVFPEIDVEEVSQILGMDIVIVTSAKTDEEAKELLSLMDMPFKK